MKSYKQVLEDTIRGIQLELTVVDEWKAICNPTESEYKSQIRAIKRRLSKATKELESYNNNH